MSIRIEQLNKHYGSFHALKNIDLNVAQGSLTVLLGPSGCGKTTLLRIIAGLEGIGSGRILFGGEDVTRTGVRERQVGFMFQHYALFRHMTVADNIAFGLDVQPKYKRMDKAAKRARVDELLKLVQLEHLARAYPAQLSGGQKQRIALARALAPSPKVLLLDEPFGALDAKVRKDLRAWLRQIQQELGITTVLVTHDQEEALEMADQIVLMNQGIIEQQGSGSELYGSPAGIFVNEFLGESNAFAFARIERDELFIGGYREQRHEPFSGSQNVSAYVRPHDLLLHSEAQPNVIDSAVITRILNLGSSVRVECRLNHYPQTATAAITPQQFRLHPLQTGQTVWLQPLQTKCFRLPELVEYVI